jgi:hypothetical protein
MQQPKSFEIDYSISDRLKYRHIEFSSNSEFWGKLPHSDFSFSKKHRLFVYIAAVRFGLCY